MQQIINFIRKIDLKVYLILLMAGLIISIAVQHKKISDLKRENIKSEQNISALTDTLKVEKTKKGDLLVSIDGYIASEKELKTLNTGLSNDVKEQKGKVVMLNRSLIKLSQDTLMLHKYIDILKTKYDSIVNIDSNTFKVPWTLAYKYNEKEYDKFEGYTILRVTDKTPLKFAHLKTDMTLRESTIDLVWGQKVVDGKLKVFIQSDYPGFSVGSLSGVLIDPNDNDLFKSLMKKKHWFNGWNIGVGSTAGYVLAGPKSGFGIVVGVSFQYSIYNW